MQAKHFFFTLLTFTALHIKKFNNFALPLSQQATSLEPAKGAAGWPNSEQQSIFPTINFIHEFSFSLPYLCIIGFVIDSCAVVKEKEPSNRNIQETL